MQINKTYNMSKMSFDKTSNERNEGRLICGDCLVELKKLPENSVDSIVTDPP